MKRPSLYLICTIAFAVHIGCSHAVADSANEVLISIAGRQMLIPSQYILPDLPSSLVPTNDQMDSGEGVILDIPLADLNVIVNSRTEETFATNLQVFIFADGSRADKLDPVAYEAWAGVGLYGDRVVERDARNGLVRIYAKSGYPKVWHYFKTSPIEKSKSDPIWVAECLISPLENEAADLANARCKRRIVNNGLCAQISFAGQYIGRIEEIANKIEMKISEWSNKREKGHP